jgi:hypothetical protein
MKLETSPSILEMRELPDLTHGFATWNVWYGFEADKNHWNNVKKMQTLDTNRSRTEIDLQ